MDLKIGIVEDIEDILKCGRVRVRVIGIHTSNKYILPTNDLPWATAINQTPQISGIGHTGCNFLNGSWVLVTSLDGDSWQNIIVLGSFIGIPADVSNVNAVPGSGGTTTPSGSGGTTTVPKDGTELPPDVPSKAIGPLSSEEVARLKSVIAKSESGGNYSSINPKTRFIGKYQFGAGSLSEVTIGYVKPGRTNKDLAYPESWTGKDGVVSRDVWYKSHQIQEDVMDEYMRLNFKRIRSLRNDSDKNHVAGCLAASHLLGAGAINKWLAGGQVKADDNGVTAEKYYKMGFGALNNLAPTSSKPTAETALPLSLIKAKSLTGFADPDVEFPKKELLNEQDTNRLARGEKLDNTIIGFKEIDRTLNVRIAGTDDVWHQPPISASPVYPYNQVSYSRGGIIEERDSTPDNVRIHQYHPSGTFTEIDNNGTKVNKIVGDNFIIMERNGNVTLKGNMNVTIEGNCNILSQGNMVAEVYGDCDIISKNDLNITSHGQIAMYAQEDFSIKAKSFSVESFTGDINLLSAVDINNKCSQHHTIDAEKDIQHRCVENMTVDVGKEHKEKTGELFTLDCGDSINLKSSNDTNIVSSASLSMKSSSPIGLRSSSSVNIDGVTIHLQEGASATPTIDSVDNLEETSLISMVTTTLDNSGNIMPKPLPSTPEEIKIRDSSLPADQLVRQELIENNVGVLSPIGNRFASSVRRYESPEDVDNNYDIFMSNLINQTTEYVTSSVPLSLDTYIPSKVT
ncbi:MAG: hypothetical protein PHG08_00310 [Bacilli bacterium]|nr:hypothetical protein [Bacilli bacterium]